MLGCQIRPPLITIPSRFLVLTCAAVYGILGSQARQVGLFWFTALAVCHNNLPRLPWLAQAARALFLVNIIMRRENGQTVKPYEDFTINPSSCQTV